MNYIIHFEEKKYELNKNNLQDFFNDDLKPIKDFNIEKLIEILKNCEKVTFEKAYYDEPCYNCENLKDENKKFFKFIEYSFYIYTKNEQYVISNIEKSYEGLSFNKLLKMKKVDNSYILTISLCENCGKYSVAIEELEI